MLDSFSYVFAFVVWSFNFFYFHFLFWNSVFCLLSLWSHPVCSKERNFTNMFISYSVQRSADFTRFIQVRTMCFVQIKCANELLIHAHFVLWCTICVAVLDVVVVFFSSSDFLQHLMLFVHDTLFIICVRFFQCLVRNFFFLFCFEISLRKTSMASSE